VPCGYNLTTTANDYAVVTHLGSGDWRFLSYQRDGGIPIDCAAVGEVKFTMAASAPANYVLGYGQALTRTSYPAYTAMVSRAQNGTRTNANATIASIANTDGFGVGMPVEGTGIGSGCTIASFVANTSITLNSSACVTSSGTSTVTVFLTGYGTSGSSSTVGVPDCRGRGIAGRDHNAPSTYAGWLSTTYAGTNGRAFNTAFGFESQTLLDTQMPSHRHSVFLNDPGHVHSSRVDSGLAANVGVTGSATSYSVSGNTGSNTTGITVRDTTGGGGTANQTALTGSGNPHPIVPPMLTAECMVRVKP
jgi:hypothetical protein